MTAPITGVDVLRATVYAQSHHSGFLARLARDVNVALDLLESFARGRAELPVEALQAIAKEFFNAELSAGSTVTVICTVTSWERRVLH
jgi:hypothetical protein